MEHLDMKIQQVVVLYLHDQQISRPPTPPIVSPCKGIMSCFSFMFLGVPRYYVRRSFNCWFTACSRVCGRGHGSNSCGPNLMVEGCTRTKQTFWTQMRTLLTGQQDIPALCPANRAFFLFFYFLAGVHFFQKKIIKNLIVSLFFFLSLPLSLFYTLWVLLSLMNFTEVRFEGKLKKGVAYKLQEHTRVSTLNRSSWFE